MNHPMRLVFYLILGLITCTSSAQQTINSSFTLDGVEREFIIYIPANYTGNTPVPLVLNLHGRSRTASNQMEFGDFRPIADTAGFIIVHPQGLKDMQGRLSWNYELTGDTAKDFKFIEALIDNLLSDYTIDQDRIYGTGFSRGVFMCCQMSCRFGDRFAAVGGVAGSFVDSTGCGAFYPKPFIQIHGTNDMIWEYWKVDTLFPLIATYNKCDLEPTEVDLPNTNTSDNSTVTRVDYSGDADAMPILHFRVNGGGHTWPGRGSSQPGTNYDIDASVEIWNFFAQYDRNGKRSTTSSQALSKGIFSISPQPASSALKINFRDEHIQPIEITDGFGRVLISTDCPGKCEVDISHLAPGMYLLRTESGTRKLVKADL